LGGNLGKEGFLKKKAGKEEGLKFPNPRRPRLRLKLKINFKKTPIFQKNYLNGKVKPILLGRFGNNLLNPNSKPGKWGKRGFFFKGFSFGGNFFKKGPIPK